MARIEILNATEELIKKLKEHDLVEKSLEWKEAIIRKDYEDHKSAKNKSFLGGLGKFFRSSEIVLESLSGSIPGVGVAVELMKGIRHVFGI